MYSFNSKPQTNSKFESNYYFCSGRMVLVRGETFKKIKNLNLKNINYKVGFFANDYYFAECRIFCEVTNKKYNTFY